MEDKIAAAFAIYDQRIVAEEELRRNPKPGMDFEVFMLAVGPATGSLINTLVKGEGAQSILEIGTSYGYSTLWLAEAARATGGRVTSLEISAAKQDYAKTMMEKAGLADVVDFMTGDAIELIPTLEGSFDFVLLDCWKDIYVRCLELFNPKLAPGALVVADNMIYPPAEHREAIAYRRAVRAVPDMASILVSVGSGLELSRKRGPLDEELDGDL